MKEVAPKIFQETQQSMLSLTTALLTPINTKLLGKEYLNLEVIGEIEELLARGASYIILNPDFPLRLRFLATKVLDSSLGPVLDWEMAGRYDIKKKLQKQIEETIGSSIEEADLAAMSREEFQWFLGEKQILDSL